jgi:hypothetical protein
MTWRNGNAGKVAPWLKQRKNKCNSISYGWMNVVYLNVLKKNNTILIDIPAMSETKEMSFHYRAVFRVLMSSPLLLFEFIMPHCNIAVSRYTVYGRFEVFTAVTMKIGSYR